MVECDVCGNYSECLHPVSFTENAPRKLDMLEYDLRLIENRIPYLCHKCIEENKEHIFWCG